MYCSRCLYPLKAITQSRCPECGNAFDRSYPTTWRSSRRPPASLLKYLVVGATGGLAAGILVLAAFLLKIKAISWLGFVGFLGRRSVIRQSPQLRGARPRGPPCVLQPDRTPGRCNHFLCPPKALALPPHDVTCQTGPTSFSPVGKGVRIPKPAPRTAQAAIAAARGRNHIFLPPTLRGTRAGAARDGREGTRGHPALRMSAGGAEPPPRRSRYIGFCSTVAS